MTITIRSGKEISGLVRLEKVEDERKDQKVPMNSEQREVEEREKN